MKRNCAVRPVRRRNPIARFLLLGPICLAASGCTSFLDSALKAVQPTPDISMPVRIGEARIKNEWNDKIQPWAAERTSDGDYIIVGSAGSAAAPIPAGSMGPRGWAAKIDQNGKVLWSYNRGLADLASVKPGPHVSYSIRGAPTYHGILPMTDGSTFLCGQMPNVPSPGSDKPWGIVTHLDKTGALISEQLLSPQVKDVPGTKGIETLQQCIRWGDGIAVVGGATRYLPRTPGAVGTAATFYWVLALDRSGKIRWEKLVPTAHLNSNFSGNLVLQLRGSDLVFSSTDDANSEVMDLSPEGEVAARMSLRGQFRLIRSVVPGNTIQIWGAERHEPKSQVLTLNERMEAVGRKEGAPYEDCFPSSVYRMPDQSYVLFGSIRHSQPSVNCTAIVHVDGNLRVARVFEPLSDSGLVDFGRLDAAAPAQEQGTFVVAMSVIAKGLNGDNPNGAGSLPDFIRGVDLNFVRVSLKNK